MSTVVACPECKQSLAVPPDMVGKTVRCPSCARTFVADAAADAVRAATPPPPAVPEWEKPPPDEEFAAPIDDGLGTDEGTRRRRKKGKAGGGYYEELVRRQRKRMEPHRGVLILILGILGVTCLGISGIFAWVMGSNDLNEIYSGRMDPEGETLTKVGRILGIVSICLNAVLVVGSCSCCIISALVKS